MRGTWRSHAPVAIATRILLQPKKAYAWTLDEWGHAYAFGVPNVKGLSRSRFDPNSRSAPRGPRVAAVGVRLSPAELGAFRAILARASRSADAAPAAKATDIES